MTDPLSHPADKALNDQFNMAHDLLEQIAKSDRLNSIRIRMAIEGNAKALDAVHHDWMERKLTGR